MRPYLLYILFLLFTNTQAQLTHTLTQTAHINNGGLAEGVAVSLDGTVFLANSDDGLRAYSYNGASFINTAYIDDGNEYSMTFDVAVSSDSTVFLAKGEAGLWAYNYDGTTFTNTAHINDGNSYSWAESVAIGSDSTVFLVHRGAIGSGPNNGLRAYSYAGTSFTNTDHIYNGSNASGVVVSPDGTVFLANLIEGLWAYSYDGSSLTNTAYINDGDMAINVAVGPDGTVFLANGYDGLRAYSYSGTSFINKAHAPVDSGVAVGVAVALDGTVFLATPEAGLLAYSYNDTSFINTAQINDGGEARDVAVGPDGTVFLANGDKGLIAYTYSGYTGIADKLSKIPHKYELFQNYPNPFNPKTTIEYQLPKSGQVNLLVYNLLGQKVATLISKKQMAGTYQLEWDATGFASGIYLYRLKTDNGSVQTKKLILLR